MERERRGEIKGGRNSKLKGKRRKRVGERIKWLKMQKGPSTIRKFETPPSAFWDLHPKHLQFLELEGCLYGF